MWSEIAQPWVEKGYPRLMSCRQVAPCPQNFCNIDVSMAALAGQQDRAMQPCNLKVWYILTVKDTDALAYL